MASKSKAAQERLTSLEKASAPFDDQLIEAAKFIGVHLEVIGRSVKEFRNKAVYHGREEWLLRWILKKLSDKKDTTPQQSPDAWWLLGYLIQSVPRNTAARLLVEKKFTEILRATVEGLNKAAGEAGQNGEEKPEESKKSSKKRKRTPVEESANASKVNITSVLQAAHAVLSFITTAAESVASQENGRDMAFTAEYMKSTIRTSAEESAKLLGLWLSLLSRHAGSRITSTWLSPFIDIWQSRVVGENDLMVFSLHCTKPMLQLLKDGHWKSELEMLAARNILIPARSDLLANAESQLLSTLTKVFVIQDPATAPVFFDIAIRSIQTHGNGRRKQHDDSWLQHAFNVLQEGFVAKRHLLNCTALHSMLLSAIHFKVKLDLPSLRKVTSQYALSEEEPDWSLVAALLKLDGNVFLIPDPSEDLLSKLLSKITKLPFRDGYQWSETVSSDVLIPLMHEFAKARDLNGFLHHWHAELVKFEKLREEVELKFFSPWEGDSLQKELQKIFEPSLTLQQIAQILEWLESEVNDTPNAVSVILQAIAGAVSNEDVVDAVGIRLYRIVRNAQLDKRYRWRSWNILSQSLNWIQKATLEELELMCKSDASILSDLRKIHKAKFEKERDNLEISEKFRAMCSLWNATEPGSTFNTTIEPLLLGFLNVFIEVLDKSIGNILAFKSDVSGERDEPKHSTNRGFSWTLSSCVHTLFVEYPTVLMLGPKLEEESGFIDIMSNIFLLADDSDASLDPKTTFRDLWLSLLRNDLVLNCPPVTATILEIMLGGDSSEDTMEVQSFAIQSLLEMPLDLFSKSDRERVMTKWSLKPDMMAKMAEPMFNVLPLDPAILSLQVKVMHKPTFYEDMSFQSLVSLAEIFPEGCVTTHKNTLSIFKELVRLTISQMTNNPDQARTREYLTSTLDQIKKKMKSIDFKNKGKTWNYAEIALLDVTLRVLHNKIALLSEADIISASRFQNILKTFKESLLTQMEATMKKLEKKVSRKETTIDHSLNLLSILDALPALEIMPSELASTKTYASTLMKSEDFLNDNGLDTGTRLAIFFATFSDHGSDKLELSEIGDVLTSFGRQAIIKEAQLATSRKTQKEKLAVLDLLVGSDSAGLMHLEKLLAIRQVIASCEDTQKRSNDEGEEKSQEFDLTTMYTILCGTLWRTTEVRRFRLISETMVFMLRTKGRCMSQWSIDSTLGSITIMCSRNGPSLHSMRAGTIYLNLCQIMQAVLTSHRLKLQGHFHLVVQVMQALLRCLFIPLPHSTTKTTKFMAPPPWLSSTKHQLGAKHAEAYTRLLTLICDPSVSSVTRSQHNSLTSATQKAKGMAAQHMQYVLTTYIRLQLEMRMLPEIREKMVPGIYAIFDTTTPEMRRMINESLDSSGRSVFTTLFRDYQKFGKWKG